MRLYFTLILMLALFTATPSQGAVVYTDIADISSTLNPNPGWDDGFAPIDFNNDGTEEFNFRWDDFGGNTWFTHVTAADPLNYLVQTTGTYNFAGGAYVEPLTMNTVIDATGSWEFTFPEPLPGDLDDNNFQGLGDRYIGVQFQLNGNTHFGWILIELDNNLTLTIKSYAYDDTPNAAIQAGDVGNGNGNVAVASIAVQGQGGASTITTQGGTLQMEATVLPGNATDPTVTWSVSNGTGAATISNNGLLTATSNGTVTVTATANDGSGVSDDAVITISNQDLVFPVSAINVQGLNGVSSITTLNGTLQMEATVLPVNATDPSITWSVSDGTGSGTISNGGLLNGTAVGTVTVTATANDGSGVSGEAVITISNDPTGVSYINKAELLVYPNPAYNQLFIQGRSDMEINSIAIYSMDGKAVYQQSDVPSNLESIDVSFLSSGHYMLRIQSAGQPAQNTQFLKN